MELRHWKDHKQSEMILIVSRVFLKQISPEFAANKRISLRRLLQRAPSGKSDNRWNILQNQCRPSGAKVYSDKNRHQILLFYSFARETEVLRSFQGLHSSRLHVFLFEEEWTLLQRVLPDQGGTKKEYLSSVKFSRTQRRRT